MTKSKIPRPEEPGLPIPCISCGNPTLDYVKGLCTKHTMKTFGYLLWKHANDYPMTNEQRKILGQGAPST